MKRTGLLIGAALLLFAAGCAEKEQKTAEITPTPMPVQTEAVTLAPTASPTPSPTPLFVPADDRGNLIINEDLEAKITPTVFALPEDSVILIYHTHGEEAYRQTKGYTYQETGENTYKTLEADKSVIAVGRLLQQELEARGYKVLHDETDCEPPDIYSAYSRSLEVMEKYPEANVFIDLHRNAASVREKKDDVIMLDGKRCARMFMVVGTGVGTYEGEYDIQPDWQKNYLLAKSLMSKLQEVEPTFCGAIRLKVGRFNQHMGEYTLLIELGHNANTFEDVCNSVPYLAEAISQVLVLEGT